MVAGGITFTLKTVDVFAKNDNKIVIEDSTYTDIEVLTNNTSIEIVPTESSVATVEYSGDTNKKSTFTLDANVKGETLYVNFKEKRRFFWFGFGSFNSTLTINVPEKQYESIQVESDNGRISVEDVKAEDVVLETENGQILLKKIEANSVYVKTDNGKVIFEHVKGKIKGITDNGRIIMTTKKLDQPIELATDNGSIEIKTEFEPTNATIEAKTDNGRITIFGVEDTFASYSKGENLIKLRTDNGRITITK
ncbi:MAG: DUF4097 family beta strand repeat-containing protein [Paenisporosarcina sp.]